jgi:hypothetical protein
VTSVELRREEPNKKENREVSSNQGGIIKENEKWVLFGIREEQNKENGEMSSNQGGTVEKVRGGCCLVLEKNKT